MYLPRRFAETDCDTLLALLDRDPFVTLVTVDAEGLPFASHLPVLCQRDGDQLQLKGHWARPNPQARHGGGALVIVHGPHAYLSPRWYADPASNVPTWNYAVAHLRGRLETFDDAPSLQRLVAELSTRFEPAGEQGWRFPESAPGTRGELAGIIGFRLLVSDWQMKFKLNQNHPAENVEGAASALAAQGGEAAEIAALMRERLARRHPAT